MAALLWLAALFLAETSGQRGAPTYTAASIVNAAANVPGLLAPNTFVSIYGADLSLVTRQLQPEDIRGGQLPIELPGTGVRVLINRVLANIYYVSPTQINLLIPPTLEPGPAEVRLVLGVQAGPAVTVQLDPTAPALFQIDARYILGVHGDGALITRDAPARAGEDITLYATGLGPTTPPAGQNELPLAAAPLRDVSTLRLVLDGRDLEARRVSYAGVAPGYAGLYQINLKLPDDLGADPEVRVGFGERLSPAELRLPVK